MNSNLHPIFREALRGFAPEVEAPKVWPMPERKPWPFKVQPEMIPPREVGKLTPAPALEAARSKVALFGKPPFNRHERAVRFLCFTGPKGARTGSELVEAPSYWYAMLRIAEIADQHEGCAGYRSVRCTDPEGQYLVDCMPVTVDASDDTGPGTLATCRWCGSEWDSHEEFQRDIWGAAGEGADGVKGWQDLMHAAIAKAEGTA